jgi:hypothetical protein
LVALQEQRQLRQVKNKKCDSTLLLALLETGALGIPSGAATAVPVLKKKMIS